MFSGENAESYYDEGLTASMRGDSVRAVQCFMRVLELDPSSHAAHYQLGKAYASLGNHEKAISTLHAVVTKRPDQFNALLALANAYLDAGHVAHASRHFASANAIKPGSYKPYLGLARCAYTNGEWKQALAHAEQAAAQKDGDTFPVHYMLGRSLRLIGEAPEQSAGELLLARKILENHIDVDPDKPEGYYLCGELAYFQEHLPIALERYVAAEERAEFAHMYHAFGEHFTLLDILSKHGLCLKRLGQSDKAREIAEKILAVDPLHPIGKSLRDA